MTARPGDPRDDRLEAREREALRELVGEPPRRLLERTMDEVELEVVFEDLVILMVEAGTTALGGFLDLAAMVPAVSPDDDKERGE